MSQTIARTTDTTPDLYAPESLRAVYAMVRWQGWGGEAPSASDQSLYASLVTAATPS